MTSELAENPESFVEFFGGQEIGWSCLQDAEFGDFGDGHCVVV